MRRKGNEMFSKNSRISSRQIKYIVWLESLAKLCLLYPVYLEGKSLGSVIVCVVVGLLFSLWFSTLVVRWSEGRDFFTCISEATCRPCAVLVYVAGFLYFLASAAVFLSLGAEAVRTYLLPEVPVPVLVIPLFLAGIYLCLQGIEVRGRFCEVSGPVVVWLMILLVFASAFGMDAYQYEDTRVSLSDGLASGAYDVFACLGSVFLPLLTAAGGRGELCEDGGSEAVRSLRRGICGSVVTAGCLTAVTVASYGKNSLSRLQFPAIRVMSNVTIPGGFFRRWEVLFLLLLLFSLTASVAGAFWYMRVICNRLFGEKGKWKEKQEDYWFEQDIEDTEEGSGNLCAGMAAKQSSGFASLTEQPLAACDFAWLFSVAVAWLAASGFLDESCAVGYYRGLNLYFLLPILIFLYLVMFFRKKRRRVPLALLGAALCFFLSGCTARELEERLFPMALEIGTKNGMVELTYAWNEGSGPGSKQEPGENGGEKSEEKKEEKGEGDDAEKRDDAEQMNDAEKTDDAGEEDTEEADGLEKSDESDKESGADNGNEEQNLTTFCAGTLSEIREQVLEYTGQYVDYSHVKAVIMDESLAQYPELEKELLEWMEAEPEFATSLIVYPAQRSGLSLKTISGKAQGRIGPYLENLYKNNEKYRESAITLGEVLAYYNRK